MNEQQAWTALFSQQVPASVNLDEAASLLEGREIDAGITLDKGVDDRASDFLTSPATFIAANANDPRVAQWTRLANALPGATVVVTASTGSAPAPAVTTPVPPPPPARPTSLKASALLVAGSASAAGSKPAVPHIAVTPHMPAAALPATSAPPSPPQPAPAAADPAAAGSPERKKDEEKDIQQTPAAIPDPVQAFQDLEDRTRTAAELVREDRVPENETPAQRRRRLDLERAEREKRWEDDVRERARRRTEEEQARARRIADESAAAQARRLADLELAAEQRRLDAEEAERKRLADEEADERRLRRKEEADKRKRLIDEEAADRKRQADEAARLARVAQEEAEAKAARPRPSRVAQRVPVSLIATLQSQPYLAQRDRVLDLARRAREGDATARAELDALVASLRQAVRRMAPGYQVVASAELQLALIESVEAGRDKTDAAWFQANFVTGSY